MSWFRVIHQTEPANPPVGESICWVDPTTKKLISKNSDGVKTEYGNFPDVSNLYLAKVRTFSFDFGDENNFTSLEVLDATASTTRMYQVVEAGTYFHLILKMPVATATASQIIRGTVSINGCFE